MKQLILVQLALLLYSGQSSDNFISTENYSDLMTSFNIGLFGLWNIFYYYKISIKLNIELIWSNRLKVFLLQAIS